MSAFSPPQPVWAILSWLGVDWFFVHMEVLLPQLKKGFVWDWGKGLGLLGGLEGLPGVYFVSDEGPCLCAQQLLTAFLY